MKHFVSAAILGTSDGATSIAGVIAGAAGAGVTHSAIAVSALGGAFAATVSMSGGELLSESATDWEAIGSMGGGTLIGSALPALPLLFIAGGSATMAVIAVDVLIGLLVGYVRARATDTRVIKAQFQSLAIITVGALVGLLAGRFI
jgi:VIT1/CCC1 family predicted Fe2+/Mn2+ transporter